MSKSNVPPWLANAKTGPSKKPKGETKKSGGDSGTAANKVYAECTDGTGNRAYKIDHASGFHHGNSKYNESYVEALYEYFNIPGYTTDTGQAVSQGRVLNGIREGADFPSIAGYCVKVKITPMTYHRWATDVDEHGKPKYGDFSLAAQYAKAVQQDILLNNSLKGHYNSGMSKFVLNTMHDMVEKSSRDVNMSGAINISIDSEDNDL
jgi:hypothetical protein